MLDNLLTALLVAFDWLMDLFTLGRWSREIGDERYPIKTKDGE